MNDNYKGTEHYTLTKTETGGMATRTIANGNGSIFPI